MLVYCVHYCIGIIQFSFIPSPNIQLSQTAVYRCSVLHVDTSDTVSVQWKINGISSSNSHFMSYTKAVGISMEGIGTQNSTVSVPGTHSLNGTTVECLATGLLKGGIPYGNKSRSILYVQGMMTLRKQIWCIVFTWRVDLSFHIRLIENSVTY